MSVCQCQFVLFLSMFIYVYSSLHLYPCPSINPPVYTCLPMSIYSCPFNCTCIMVFIFHLSIHLYIYQVKSIKNSIYLPIYPSMSIYFCLSRALSIHVSPFHQTRKWEHIAPWHRVCHLSPPPTPSTGRRHNWFQTWARSSIRGPLVAVTHNT